MWAYPYVCKQADEDREKKAFSGISASENQPRVYYFNDFQMQCKWMFQIVVMFKTVVID